MAGFGKDDRDIELGLPGVASPSGSVVEVRVMEQRELTGECWSTSPPNLESDASTGYVSYSTATVEGDDSSIASIKDSTSTRGKSPSTQSLALAAGGDIDIELGLPRVTSSSGSRVDVREMEQNKLTGECWSTSSPNPGKDEECTGSESLPYMIYSYGEGDDSRTGSSKDATSTCDKPYPSTQSLALASGEDNIDIEKGLPRVSSRSSVVDVRVMEQSELTGVHWSTSPPNLESDECTGSESLPYTSYSTTEGDYYSTASCKDATSTHNQPPLSYSPTPYVALDLGDGDFELEFPGVSGAATSGSVGVILVMEQDELSLPYKSDDKGDKTTTSLSKDKTLTSDEPSPSTHSLAMASGEKDIELGLPGVAGPSGSAVGVRVMEQNESTGECCSILSPNLESDEAEYTGSESLPNISYSDEESDGSSTARRKDSILTANQQSSPHSQRQTVPLVLRNVDTSLGLPRVAGTNGSSVDVCIMEQNELTGEFGRTRLNLESEEAVYTRESLPNMSYYDNQGKDSTTARCKDSTSTRDQQSIYSPVLDLGYARNIELGLPGVAGPSGIAEGVRVMDENEITGESLQTSTNTALEEYLKHKDKPYTGILDYEIDFSAILKNLTPTNNEQSNSPSPTPSEILIWIGRLENNAARAFLSSRATLKDVNEAIIIGIKRERTARKLSEMDDYNRNSFFYRNVAKKYNDALDVITKSCTKLEETTNTAEADIKNASRCARELAGQPLEDSDFDVSNKTSDVLTSEQNVRDEACVAAKKAYRAVCETREMERKVLKAMQRCWMEIEYHAEGDVVTDPRNATIYGANCDPQNRRLRHVAHAILFILGCSLIGISMLISESSGSFTALLTVGVFLVAWPFISLVHEIHKRYLKARHEAQRKKTKEVLATLARKIQEIETYLLYNSEDTDVSENGNAS